MASATKEKKDSRDKAASSQSKSVSERASDNGSETSYGSARGSRSQSSSRGGSRSQTGSDGDVSAAQMEKELGAGFDFGAFFGEMFAFNNSLKLYHWHVSGPGSYAEHMALDQAIASLSPILDRIVETTYSMQGDIDVVIPQTQRPQDIAGHCQDFYDYLDEESDMFGEEFSQSIIQEYQEVIQQLLYRLRRLR